MWLVATILSSVVLDDENATFRNSDLKKHMEEKKKIRQN